MKKILPFLLLTVLVILTSCGVKKAQNDLYSGNYDDAIQSAVEKLAKNKTSKSNQKYIPILEEAFIKAKERDLQQLNILSKEYNPANLEKIYQTYVLLDKRQNMIKPLVPLYNTAKGREAFFTFSDYSDELVSSKKALVSYLYDDAGKLLTGSKMDARKAFEELSRIESLSPNYKDTRNLIEQAHFKGIDFVRVDLANQTQMMIPKRLQDDLLNFDTYGLNDIWTVYHTQTQPNINYDYGIQLAFTNIMVSPEQVREKQFYRERDIIDGRMQMTDASGRPVVDSTGRPIMVDRYIRVRADIYEANQFKQAQVVAKVNFYDYRTQQLINSYPLNAEFVFQNLYSTYRGDRRAIESDYWQYIDRRPMPFPSNEQMVYDCGEDLKNKFKSILRSLNKP